jgi:DNA-binding transcriptional MerR regulator
MSTTESRSQTVVSAQELAAVAGITLVMLRRVVRLGLIEPLEPGGREFPAACAPRLKRMLRLRLELGLNLAGAAVVVDLLERLARLEAELGRVRARSSRALETS